MLEFEILKNRDATKYSLADAKAWADDVIQVDNTETGWAESSLTISTFKLDKMVVVVDFGKREAANTHLDNKADESHGPKEKSNNLKMGPTDATLNLQYFFPSCDQALRANAELMIILAIICGSKDDQQRVRKYLSAVNRIKKRLCVCTVLADEPNTMEDCELSSVWYSPNDIGALLPLLCVGETRYVRTSDDSLSKGIEDLTTIQLSENVEELYRYSKNEPCTLADPRTRPQYHMLQKVAFHAIDIINEHILGDAEKEETVRERKAMISQFWSIVTEGQGQLKRRPFLTQVIWLIVLRDLMRLGELQKQLDNGDKVFLIDRIYLSLWDSIAYSEGIFQLLENSEQHSQHHIGYLSVYVHNISLKTVKGRINAAERRIRIFHKYGFNNKDEVVRVDDNCCLEFNVTDMGRDKEYKAQGVERRSGKTLHELFSGYINPSIEEVVHHYGMPLFFRTVQLKCGRFICTTPSEDSKAARYMAGRDAHKKEQSEPQYQQVDSIQPWTSYQILLPVSFLSQKSNFIIKTDHGHMLDATLLRGKVMPSEYALKIIESPKFSKRGGSISAQEKIAEVNRVCKHFREVIGGEPLGNTVYCLKATGLSLLNFEIYLKGFFQYIVQIVTTKSGLSGPPLLLLFRLSLLDDFAIGEALRRFANFYDRFGTNQWMKHVQIALCNDNPTDGNDMTIAPIRLVLAGENINEAYVTAKQYMYYNADLNSGFLLGQAEYLSRQQNVGKGTISAVPLFPFDLVKGKCGTSNFMQKVEKQLNSELQECGLGCKIPDAHIRLGSKIHIRDFYDAELLFQSVANVYRFAYLLAERIIKALRELESADFSELLLIGYENYSALLVSEVKRLIEEGMDLSAQSKRKTVYHGKATNLVIDHLQFIREGSDSERIVYVGKEKNWEFNNNLEENKRACIIILPIGTTLSTIYKIRNVFQRQFQLQNRPTLLGSYALIVVENSVDGISDLSNGYWTADSDGDVITLEPESSQSKERVEIQCFLHPKTRWMHPDKCEFCGMIDSKVANHKLLERIPLGQVDKTSTIPRLIFPIRKKGINHGIGFLPEENNRSKLEQLKGCIGYGHIQDDANHFQFFVQYDEYYRKIREQCVKWLGKLRGTINENEFHIIVSPLRHDNSLFIKDVIDHVFQHSLRFIYVQLNQAYREEFRSRFNHIAREYQDACAGAEPPKYNVYYVDYSLVSGQSLRRSESLIRMLMKDTSVDFSAQVFQKVILLTNRSSYDTAAGFVNNPTKDFAAFSTLRVPSFNTMSNHCPTCELVDVYQEIAKCCATNELYWYYQNIAQKHQLRSPEEHLEWTKRFHFNHPHYLQSFCQSLWHQQDINLQKQKKERLICAITEAVAMLCSGRTQVTDITLQKVVNQIRKNTKNDDEWISVSDLVNKCYWDFIDGRNWRRLICTHEAMKVVEDSLSKSWSHQQIRIGMWETIRCGLEGRTSNFDKREWLISYVKVFSREYPAKIAPIRRAVFSLLELLMDELLAQRDEPSDLWRDALDHEVDLSTLELLCIRNVEDNAEILQLYQLYQILAKRLCDLQSILLLQYPILQKVDGFILQLKKKGSDYCVTSDLKNSANTKNTAAIALAPLVILPTNNQIQTDYLRMIKWAAMSSSDDAKAFLLQQLSKHLIKEGEAIQQDSIDNPVLNLKTFGKVIQQENTRMLYSGIKRLNERVSTDTEWAGMEHAVENAWNDAKMSADNGIRYLAQNPMTDMFRFLDADSEWTHTNTTRPPYLEQLTALLGFYRAVVDLCEDKMLEERKDYVERYFELCFYLSKIGGAKNCCIVHRTNGENQIISRYINQEISQTSLEKEIERILYNVCKYLGKQDLNNTVCSYPNDAPYEKASALVLALQIRRRVDIKHLQDVYVVLFNTKEGDTPATPIKGFSHYLLFMRQRLQMLLERDLYALHHFKTSLEDVGRTTHSKKLCILHLTDLHVSPHNKGQILKLINSNQKKLKQDNPELLVVTGDVVQGNSTAVDLETNYKCAAEILLAIARILWPQPHIGGGSVLRSDWNKRIIVIPGNHDYASMNELSANHALRTTTGGVPDMRNGSPMSKYSYFIQFLQDFLGVDSRSSIHRNLNSLLEYPQLNLRVIALNSIAEVGPLRNNKVQLDKEFIEHLAQIGAVSGTATEYMNIILAHHTRCYEPDYFSDRYWEKGLTKEVCELAKDLIWTCLRGKVKIEALYAANSSVGQTDIKELLESVKKELAELKETRSFEYSVLEKDLAKSVLLSDVTYVCEHWAELTNERCAQVFSDYIRSVEMSKHDLNIYSERLSMLESVFHNCIMLGGHTHRAGRTRSLDQKGCVEGPQFYSEREGKTQLNFGRLLIYQNKADYEFSPDTLESYIEAKV